MPEDAYHAARLRRALAADCGTCVEAEINLALAAGLSKKQLRAVINGDVNGTLAQDLALRDAVVLDRTDGPFQGLWRRQVD